jgi:hypothetical protein
MTENFKLDRSFGPVGSFSGMILFVVGSISTFFYFSGLILVLIGAFVGFTSTSTMIDYVEKRIKFSNNIFGFIKTGQWISIVPEMKIGIKKSDIMWRAYSRGNRTLDIDNNGFRITLLNSNDKEIMEIKKADSLESAKLDQETISQRLGLLTVLTF